MPDTIQFGNGNQIINRYAADGRKLGTEYFTRVTEQIVPQGLVINQSYVPSVINQNGTAYIDNKEYNTLNGISTMTTISRVHNPEGYASYNTSPYLGFIYNRTDHLGNIREVWHASSKTTIQRTQYYPSGLPWETTPADNLSTQPYKYNGKEFVEMNGYDTYDYGVRGYYAASGRFMTVDPHAEKYYSISPYAYCSGNPVNAIDKDGMDATDPKPATDQTEAIDNTANKVPQKIEPIQAPPDLVQKEALKDEKSTDKKAQLSQTDKMVVTELDKGTSGNVVVQTAVLVVTGAVVVPTSVTAGGTALIATESSVALSIGGGVVEGVVKTVIQAPNDFYIIPIPLSQVTSDATQGFMYFVIPTTRK